jgi:hypothetical protein
MSRALEKIASTAAGPALKIEVLQVHVGAQPVGEDVLLHP